MLTDGKFLDDPRRAMSLGVGFSSPLWPTFLAAAGAGVAFWAWAQWARGKAQSEFAGAGGFDVSAPPAATTATPVAARPEQEPETDQAANDPETAPVTVEPVVSEAVSAQLDETLAIQAPAESEPLEPVAASPEPARAKRAAPLIEAVAPRKTKALASAAAAPLPKSTKTKSRKRKS